ncbi:hypothetical protein H0I23_00795 [Cellulophaga sp. HaHaR_3_176]|uniref:DUF5458 family protein n=1 Tax=Cellulophaga sp. HaHaR_3_176 TaxID=1942464 RepID=UPI001C1F4A03|nr:DUF5458 family protein [Cellulophaga sp. HaHaR_3_176]QWX84220.1 hypothetical protein H0I23_00795 [Cellulophaga sp. HaHaR_3_176]
MAQVFGSQFIKKKQTDIRNGISNIPTNRTMYLEQLTLSVPVKPLLVKGLGSLQSIFNYFRPSVAVFHEDYQGAIAKETFVYASLDDFEPENLVTKSAVLKQLKIQQVNCLELLKAEDNTRFFTKITKDKEVLENFLLEFESALGKGTELDFIEKQLKAKTSILKMLFSHTNISYTVDRLKKAKLKSSYKSLKGELSALCYLWHYLFINTTSKSDFQKRGKEYYTVVEDRFKANLLNILEIAKPLEIAYYGLNHFIKNTEEESISNLTIINVDKENCSTLDNPVFFNLVAKELKDTYDRLDMMDHYSLMVFPGYFGSHNVLTQWSKIASEHKVVLVTDFSDLDTPEDVVELFEKAEHVQQETYLANTIMTCNWLVARGANKWLGEKEPLYVAPSPALAGKLYSSLLSQACAGTEFGRINSSKGVRFLMTKNDLSTIEQKGLIPMYYTNGNTIAYSAKTLFNGDNLGLQTYSVVRVFDYLSKVLVDYLNQRTFENFNVNIRKETMEEIIQFLDKHVGSGRLISNFKVLRFEKDPKHKDQVLLNLNITPYFPAKNFLIRMYGKSDMNTSSWKTDYSLVK